MILAVVKIRETIGVNFIQKIPVRAATLTVDSIVLVSPTRLGPVPAARATI